MAITDKKQAREELRKKLAARKEERKADNSEKYARLRQVAAEEPKEVDTALNELAEALGHMADALTGMRSRLDLIRAPKTAKMSERIAAARKYATAFRRYAEESPEIIGDALSEVYQALDQVGLGVENLADQMGVELSLEGAPESDIVEEQEETGMSDTGAKTDKGFSEFIDKQKDKPEEDKEASDEPEEAPEKDDEEVKEASGSDMFITDRDKAGKPEAPKRMEIPEAQGKAASREALRKRIEARRPL
jgi:hypothetical protein